MTSEYNGKQGGEWEREGPGWWEKAKEEHRGSKGQKTSLAWRG